MSGVFAIFNSFDSRITIYPSDSIPISLARRVAEALPVCTSNQRRTNSSDFHVIKIPRPDRNMDRLQQLVVEYTIQSTSGFKLRNSSIWWTSYVVLAVRGTLTRGTGVYTEWDEFGTFSSTQAEGVANVTLRTSGIIVLDISKGVISPHTSPNGVVLRVVDLSGIRTRDDMEIFAVLIAAGTESQYEAQGQARLEYSIQIPVIG